jgi:hypothetical protein
MIIYKGQIKKYSQTTPAEDIAFSFFSFNVPFQMKIQDVFTVIANKNLDVNLTRSVACFSYCIAYRFNMPACAKFAVSSTHFGTFKM